MHFCNTPMQHHRRGPVLQGHHRIAPYIEPHMCRSHETSATLLERKSLPVESNEN